MINHSQIAIAGMNEFVMATSKKPILGTYGLATCCGLILSDATTCLLAHLSSNYEALILAMLSKLQSQAIQAYIIPGYYKNSLRIKEIKAFLIKSLKDSDLKIDIIWLNDFVNKDYESIEFGYDSVNKKFVKLDFDNLLKEETNYGRN